MIASPYTMRERVSAGEEEAWDRMAGDRFYSSSAWLRVCDSFPGSRVRPVVQRSEDGRIVGGVPVTEPEGLPLPPYRWNDLLSQAGLPTIEGSGVIVGADQGYQTHFLAEPDVDRCLVVADLIAGVRTTHPTCVALYLSTEDVLAARRVGVTAPPVLLETDTWIPLPSGGWDAYLESLSRKRRSNVRAEARAFDEAGYSVVHRDLTDVVEAVARLAVSTQSKYGVGGSAEKYATSLRRHVAVMGDRAQVALCIPRSGDDPVGFCLYYTLGETIHIRWAGFDYDRLVGAYEYFNLVYYSMIREAHRTGARSLHTGIKAVEAKALRGAALRPLWLLDLSQGSSLTKHKKTVERHNQQFLERLRTDQRTRNALASEEEWLEGPS